MQAAYDNTFPALKHSSVDQTAGGGAASAKVQGRDISIESTDLLRGSKTLEIRHNGSLYLLRTTRLNKLILTK